MGLNAVIVVGLGTAAAVLARWLYDKLEAQRRRSLLSDRPDVGLHVASGLFADDCGVAATDASALLATIARALKVSPGLLRPTDQLGDLACLPPWPPGLASCAIGRLEDLILGSELLVTKSEAPLTGTEAILADAAGTLGGLLSAMVCRRGKTPEAERSR